MSDEGKRSVFSVRKATPADAPALALLHVNTFNETHGIGPGSPTYGLRLMQWQQLFQKDDNSWFCFVMEKDGDSLVGFAKGQPYDHIDQPRFSGELNKIYLLRKYQGLGLGRQLICNVAHEFIGRGITAMLLFGDANNPSNRFYERMGAEKLFAKNGDFHGGYGWKDLQVLINICSAKEQ